MKIYILLIMLLVATNLFAQHQQDSNLVKEIPTIKNKMFQQRRKINVLKIVYDSLNRSTKSLSEKIENQDKILQQQKISLSILKNKNKAQKQMIDSFSNLISVNSQKITINYNKFGIEIQKVSTNTETKISKLEDTISKTRLYWILTSLGMLLLGSLMYMFLSNRIKSSKNDVVTKIRKTKQSLEEESVKLDSKLVEILETQLKINQAETKAQPTTSSNKEVHTLALKVADEIIRIQKNLTRMDEKTKGLKQLTASVKRIQDNFDANGYEIVEMLGKPFNDGMKVSANFIPDEDLEAGQQIITRIIKPQVNYKGVMIQSAQIEVSQG